MCAFAQDLGFSHTWRCIHLRVCTHFPSAPQTGRGKSSPSRSGFASELEHFCKFCQGRIFQLLLWPPARKLSPPQGPVLTLARRDWKSPGPIAGTHGKPSTLGSLLEHHACVPSLDWNKSKNISIDIRKTRVQILLLLLSSCMNLGPISSTRWTSVSSV